MLPAILSLSGPTPTPDECALFADAAPAGYILFGRNIVDPGQLRALTDDLRGLHDGDPLILVDQEGGRVARLAPPHWPDFPAARRFGELYDRAPISGMEAARLGALASGIALAHAGIDAAAAPVLDLDLPGGDGIVGDRSFGSNPLAVGSLGRSVIEGLAEAGVAAVIKHMPGHGRAPCDSHRRLPVVTSDPQALADDLKPFAALSARARIGMVAHVVYRAWDDALPASLSPTIIADVIRGAIGFDGLLLSDDIGMDALSGPIDARAAQALAAGCDLVLHCSGSLAESRALAAALPPISDAARGRLSRARPPRPDTLPDLAEIVGKRDALLAYA